MVTEDTQMEEGTQERENIGAGSNSDPVKVLN